MKALVYTGTQELVYRDEPNPIEVSGESILKIHASGICGSDMHAYHGHDERRIPPLILGHEVSGEVQNGKFKGKNFLDSLDGTEIYNGKIKVIFTRNGTICYNSRINLKI